MRQADAPLQKITINIYKTDYEWLKNRFGQDYSVRLRDWINGEIKKQKVKQEIAGYD